jgi:hypothetical protein
MIGISLGLLAPPCPAGTITWSGAAGDSNWFTAGNWLGGAIPTNSDDVLLTNGTGIILLSNSATIKSLDITNRTLCFKGWLTNELSASNIFIRSGAKLTHPTNSATTTNGSGGWDPDNGIFIRCTNLTVYPGGEINTEGLGFGGGTPFLTNGYGPGRGIWGTGNRAGGGGYGGQGGMGTHSNAYGGAPYDTATNPVAPGSGGAGTISGSPGYGGHGGGYTKIVAAGTVTVDGVISMNGTDGDTSGYRAGASGGGLLIQCKNLAGTGTIRANGGNGGTSGGGGGGGGRIAIYATNASSFGGQMSARHGSGYYNFPDYERLASLPGTIYLSDWGLLPVFLTNGAGRFTAGTGTASSVTIGTNYTLFLEWGWETNRLKATAIILQNGGKIMHGWNTATNTVGGEWLPDGGIFIECSNLTEEAGGAINGDGLGYRGGTRTNGYGPGGGLPGVGRGGGGGSGRYDNAWGGLTYGSSNLPAAPGSGGGGGCGALFNPAAPGGGYVKIVADGTVTVNGLITMNGSNSWDYSAGGSGGGILIQCGSLAGTGAIRADGGRYGTDLEGGGGGGGRIAIYVRNPPVYTSGNVLFTTTVNGGAGYQNGFPGTIYRDFKPRGTVFQAW